MTKTSCFIIRMHPFRTKGYYFSTWIYYTNTDKFCQGKLTDKIF
jgi:hypothetical protein